MPDRRGVKAQRRTVGPRAPRPPRLPLGCSACRVQGAPGWLNLVVLILAWDAIKIALLASLETG